jgi:hypothetical protein
MSSYFVRELLNAVYYIIEKKKKKQKTTKYNIITRFICNIINYKLKIEFLSCAHHSSLIEVMCILNIRVLFFCSLSCCVMYAKYTRAKLLFSFFIAFFLSLSLSLSLYLYKIFRNGFFFVVVLLHGMLVEKRSSRFITATLGTYLFEIFFFY